MTDASALAGRPTTDSAAAGQTRVANDVVAWIAALTALQVDGVHAMYRSGGQQLDRILRRPVAHRGVRVTLESDGALRVDLWIVIQAGTNVPTVAGDVQRRVADALDRMLGMRIAAVNVTISEVVFV